MIKTQKWIKSTNTPELHSAVTLGRLHLYAVLFIFYLDDCNDAYIVPASSSHVF